MSDEDKKAFIQKEILKPKRYQHLPKEFRKELDKVLSVSLFDGYDLSIYEIKE